jgi:hypothetical protein
MVQTHRKLSLRIDSRSTVTGFGLSVVLPFNPALAYWLLPIKLGVMLSLLHLEGRAYRTAVHLQM